MNRRLFGLILVLAVFPSLLLGQTKRALLVGISDYQSSEVYTGWGNINGKNDVMLLADDLKQQGFCQLEVLFDSQATYAKIVGGLDRLIAQAALGDIVYFHFSGHGQPVLDKNHDEKSGDRWDESIIPFDAASFYMEGEYEGEHHIIDDLLHEKLLALRRKVGDKGIVYVMVDACFSGTVVRGDEEENDAPRRGTNLGFDFGENIDYDAPINRKVRYTLEDAEELADIVVLEACLPHQRNTEIEVEGKYYGPLSYHIHLVLQNHIINQNASWIDAVIQSFKKDRRIFSQSIVCESSINHGKGN